MTNNNHDYWSKCCRITRKNLKNCFFCTTCTVICLTCADLQLHNSPRTGLIELYRVFFVYLKLVLFKQVLIRSSHYLHIIRFNTLYTGNCHENVFVIHAPTSMAEGTWFFRNSETCRNCFLGTACIVMCVCKFKSSYYIRFSSYLKEMKREREREGGERDKERGRDFSKRPDK